MAEDSVLTASELLVKRVQEMVLEGQEKPPSLYVWKDGDGSEVHSVSASALTKDSSSIPVIDLGILFASTTSTEEYEKELHKLKTALHIWGCFQAIGHGIDDKVLEEIQKVAKEFFDGPMEEKKKYSKGVDELEGYGADPTPAEGQPLDWSDRLLLNVYPEDLRILKFWPQTPSTFRQILEEYAEKTKMLTDLIWKLMAKSLGLEEENAFLNQFGEKAGLQARFNYYSKCQRPDLVLGMRPHSDGSGYTTILQDEEGLQIFKDEKWHTVPKIPHAILILVGDQMEIISNGIFKSPIHRVLANLEKNRVSVAMFFYPEKGRDIGPDDDLIRDGRPRIFKKMKDYSDVHWDLYLQGLRAIHVAKA